MLGYEGYYEVSDEGCVRSLARVIDRVSGRRGLLPVRARVLRQALTIHGYPFVILCRDGKRQRRVHQLVACAFLGSKPTNKHIVNHIDGNKLNNCVSNLEWVTYSENTRHSVDVLGNGRGERGANKVSESEVRYIRQLHSEGVPNAEITRRVNLGREQVRNICKQRSWTHLE